ncbi:DUF2877 domain-containing protein [Egibacter rhizosphaerae]|uniref:DUF2877 domain-containing protein n=1 Tax=Egibacter rhizosphaerae TaxID=1670831 RepID=A0A411YD32_9ACTN|nr:DUF2877 domain-containing protein [Egibacter rhizosphaerae]QBI19095.1 DUF2877 domain-containing protein [Egibacter rhizosphaerae]
MSTAVAELLDGPARAARTLAAFDHAAYLAVDADVIALVDREAAALPNSVVVADPAPLRAIARRGPVVVGAGRLTCGEVEVVVRRWWEPRPSLPVTTGNALAAVARALPSRAPGLPAGSNGAAQRLEEAVRRREPGAAADAAKALIGAGVGLTPAGDDLLAGLLAAACTLPDALTERCADTLPVVDAVATTCRELAVDRTPLVSAALLGHAADGRPSAPAARVLVALASGRGIDAAMARLAAVGGTSGRDLLAGIRLGTRLVLPPAPLGASDAPGSPPANDPTVPDPLREELP